MAMPKVVYVTLDENSDGGEDLLAWKSLDSSDSGKVGVYTLTEELDKRKVTEVRRNKTKIWFKP